MYREKADFRAKLLYDEIDRSSRFAFLRGDIVEVDWVGDEPDHPMGVQWLDIHGTDIPLDYDEYEAVEDLPTVGILSTGRAGNKHDTLYWTDDCIPSL